MVKEGYYAFNMPKVARVIFNRLARGGHLQMDSTILYPLGQDGGTVTPAMLKINSPYNTYLYAGLTPTPICTVSKVALRAVLHAPTGTWVYFETVTKSGHLKFSTTFAEQLQAEKLAAIAGTGMNWRVGIAGSPVSHSLSPQLHEIGLRTGGLDGNVDSRGD